MKRWIVGAISAAMLAALPACGTSGQRGQSIDFYFVSTGDVLSGAAVDSEPHTLTELTVPAVVDQLLLGPEHTERLTDIVPEGTTLQDWSQDGGNVHIDLSESFSRLSGISLTKAEYCIVLTLSQLPDVETVTITADGQRLPGAATNTLSASDVLLEGETEDPVSMESQLYYPLSNRTGLGAEVRTFSAASENELDRANAILEQLLSGPRDETMLAFLPTGGRIRVSNLRQGLCTVTMDNVMLESICQPIEDYQLKLYAIVDSLCQMEEVDTVCFRLNGNLIDGWDASYTPQYEF